VSDPALAPPPFDPASLVGTTLDGRYVLSAHLATGGMGAVFRAHHVHLRKDLAVKVLRPDLTASADIVERFRREAEIASALDHDNIVKVTDFGRSEAGYLFLVMELLTGESLFERLRREGFLPPEEAVPILWQVCAALEAAHARGVIHRDLKPENVFLARTGSGRGSRRSSTSASRRSPTRRARARRRPASSWARRSASPRSKRWARPSTGAPTSTRSGSSRSAR
jgi:serine/threonine-protein kinase